MNQNVFGVILFSVIVGTAIFVSAFFTALPEAPTITERLVTYENKRSCDRESKKVRHMPATTTANIKVVQAFLNRDTNQLEIEYAIKRENSQRGTTGIALHFFAKDGSKTRYLATQTEHLTLSGDSELNVLDISSYQWLDDLQRRDNLYVIAESALSFNNDRNPEPTFDEKKATAVLIKNR